MSVSTDTVVSNLIGGAINVAVADIFFSIQERRARESFAILARFLESFASIANKGGDAKVGFTRDAKDRITNANLTVTTGTAEMRAVAHPVTVNTRTKGGAGRSWPGSTLTV